MMQAGELVRRCVDIAQNYSTLYVSGCFGAPLVGKNVDRYCANNNYNRGRQPMIRAAADKTPPVYGFDCVCLVKGVLWGWNGKPSGYGGVVYASGNVPDIGENEMIRRCRGVTDDFREIVPGAAVWMPGHIGVYIGGGLAVECSPKWANGVQITAVGNLGKKSGYHTRTWTKWGFIPYVDYKEEKDLTEKEVRAVVRDELARAQAELGTAPADKWAVPHIETCVRAGVMANVAEEGQTPMIDRPKAPLTRQEAAVMAAAMVMKN